MSLAVKEVQPTPNPNALKFVLDRTLTQERLSFADPNSAGEHPLASQLFGIGGVSSLLLLGDFVTVVKTPAAKWSSITPKVKKVLSTHAC